MILISAATAPERPTTTTSRVQLHSTPITSAASALSSSTSLPLSLSILHIHIILAMETRWRTLRKATLKRSEMAPPLVPNFPRILLLLLQARGRTPLLDLHPRRVQLPGLPARLRHHPLDPHLHHLLPPDPDTEPPDQRPPPGHQPHRHCLLHLPGSIPGPPRLSGRRHGPPPHPPGALCPVRRRQPRPGPRRRRRRRQLRGARDHARPPEPRRVRHRPHRLRRRGRGSMLGPMLATCNGISALGPVAGGAIAMCAGGPRWMFLGLLVVAAACLLLVGFTLSETARSVVGNGERPRYGIYRTWWSYLDSSLLRSAASVETPSLRMGLGTG